MNVKIQVGFITLKSLINRGVKNESQRLAFKIVKGMLNNV